MFPRVVKLVSGGATKEKLTNIMIRIGRVQAFIAMGIISVFFACGRQFVALWLEPRYKAAWIVSIVVMVGTLCHSLVASGHLILRAMNRQQFILGVYVTTFAITAVVTYIIVVDYGIVGAAFTTAISFAIGALFFIAPYLHRKIGVNMILVLKRIFLPVITPVILGITFYLAYDALFLDNWLILTAAVTMQVLIYCIVLFLFILDKDEKSVAYSAFSKIRLVKKKDNL